MSIFEIADKVAIITGGASGLGLKYALELLKKNAKAVVLADISPELGSKALQQIEKEFGKNKAIFIKTDVTSYAQFEAVFKETIKTFKNVDILINNAGIMDDSVWEKEIAINVNGTIIGILLGLENYIQRYKSGSEGLILNVSSIAGIAPFAFVPIYAGTKFAVYGLTISWGLPAHYERTKVRVVGVCPGSTVTPLITDLPNRNLGPAYEKLRPIECGLVVNQGPEEAAVQVMSVIERAPSGTMWVVEGGKAPFKFQLPDRLGVVLADVSPELGSQAVEKLESEFGPQKVIFVKIYFYCHYQIILFISTFANVDILINNAGILNDSIWRQEISINLIEYYWCSVNHEYSASMVSFNIKGKVAIVTGGASGLGLHYALELLKKQAKAVVIADVSAELGRKAIEQFEREFGAKKAIFIKADVTDYNQFENVFKTTISTFQNVDILINNAGIFNDSIWQQEIAINLNGTINGVLLGLENYIKNFKSGDEGLILNISSIAATAPYGLMPGYVATKFAIHGLTLSWGVLEHYNRTKVRVVAIAPGLTVTPLLTESANKTFGPDYERFADLLTTLPLQRYSRRHGSAFSWRICRKMAAFNIKGKVAVVTGGAAGLGFQFARHLLKKQAKAVVLADILPESGQKAVLQLEKEFGLNKAIFIKTDVSDYDQFENVFKTTVSTYKNVDILINNAGIFNDSIWQREIEINLKGTINRVLLALENYIKNNKSGEEGLIVNVSSIAGIAPLPLMPAYVATKFGIHGLTLSWGSVEHYNRTKVRVVGICPGATTTPMLTEVANRTFGAAYEELLYTVEAVPGQGPEDVGPHAMTVVESAPTGTMWVLEGGEPPFQFQLPDRFNQPKVFLRHKL
ncbi:hypothetical protein YQE_04359, partial [Dendroctonus ponderosae]